jgi:hypothetical protein
VEIHANKHYSAVTARSRSDPAVAPFPRGFLVFAKIQNIVNLCNMAKAKKARAAKYDEKLAINGTFDELIKVSVNYTPPKKEKAKKAPKKKK